MKRENVANSIAVTTTPVWPYCLPSGSNRQEYWSVPPAYCCMAQDSLDLGHLSGQIKVGIEKQALVKTIEDLNQYVYDGS